MKLSSEEVEHISLLARLGLTDEETERLSEQLSNILENFEVLQQVDTENIPPTAQSISLQNVTSDDRIEVSYPPEEILENAPRQEDGFFRVRPVLE